VSEQKWGFLFKFKAREKTAVGGFAFNHGKLKYNINRLREIPAAMNEHSKNICCAGGIA